MKVACTHPHSTSPARMYFARIANTNSHSRASASPKLDRSVLPPGDFSGHRLGDQSHGVIGSLTLWDTHAGCGVVQVAEQLYQG
jgi:hypothetical protein